MKPVSSDTLLRAIERAVAIHGVARNRNVQLRTGLAYMAKLTPREKEVFELVVRGHTNKDAARSLGCTERTIKAHRHRVMEKMQVQSLAQLVSLAERLGVMPTTEFQPKLSPIISSASIIQTCAARSTDTGVMQPTR